MIYFLILTNNCNLNCKYCGEQAFNEPDDFPEPICEISNNIKYDLKKLKNVLRKEKNPYVIFYGGEPLLNIPQMEKTIDFLKDLNVKYILQTNGIFLNKIKKEYLKYFESIFISIDGNKSITSKYRGEKTYDTIIENINYIKNLGYKKEITARMTILNQNIYKNVKHLLNTKLFSSIHWQLDANFWFNDYKKRNFEKFSNENYIPNLKKLIDFWIQNLKKGKIIKIYPFIGIINNLLYERKTKLMCGAGFGNFTIQTDGKVIPCPIMAGMKNYYLGDINKNTKIKKLVFVPNDCKKCKYLNLCGTRCLYSNILNPWPKNEKKQLCKNTIFLIEELQKNTKLIKKLINAKILSKKDFHYLKYNGAEIIP